MTERWEYKVVYIDAQRWTGTGLPSELNEDFDRWGAEGWELVAIDSMIGRVIFSGTQTVGLVAFFKRRVAAQPGGGTGGP
jgi:hypothetical protein